MSSDRFYLLEFRNRPVLKGDIGSLLKISGLVVEGGGVTAILLLPSNAAAPNLEKGDVPIHELSVEDWSDFIQRSDVPELLGPEKIFHRKTRFEISGAVQQKIWVADGLKCMYCGAVMGKSQLTVDHFIPIELGGKNDHTNYLSACRKCNKDKGSEDPVSFCNRRKISYSDLVAYLLRREV